MTTQYKIDSVSNGSQFNLLATNITYGFKSFVGAENEIDKTITGDWNSRLPVGTYQGFEAPRIKITGKIDTEDSNPPTNAITVGWLGSLARTGSVGYFFDDKITGFANLGSLPTMITNVDLIRGNRYTGSDVGYIVDYSMGLVEVSGPSV